MEDISKLIQALSSLFWPILALFIIWRFRSSISQVIESAKGRKFTIKVGGQELTMDEASTQQEKTINDLRNQINAIQQFLNINPLDLANQISFTTERPASSNSVLWVDDNPKNNSYLISSIQNNGYPVELAKTTNEALKFLAQNQYRVIISDMGRDENGEYRQEAGLELLQKLRAENNPTPFVVYCSSSGARKYKEAVIANGGISATSSSSVLFSLIKEFIPYREA
jgi:CheY-like chemotaxis protein